MAGTKRLVRRGVILYEGVASTKRLWSTKRRGVIWCEEEMRELFGCSGTEAWMGVRLKERHNLGLMVAENGRWKT